MAHIPKPFPRPLGRSYRLVGRRRKKTNWTLYESPRGLVESRQFRAKQGHSPILPKVDNANGKKR